jgi:hypothetical protein
VIFLGSTMSASIMTSASSIATIPSILAIPISEKLTNANYPLWSAQVLLAIHAAQLNDLLIGADSQPEKELTTIVNNKPVKSRNPVYSAWVAWD